MEQFNKDCLIINKLIIFHAKIITTRENEVKMDKIKALLEKAGCKPELVNKICESLSEYKTTLSEQYEADHKAKLAMAKKVCIEETEAHKRELARRLQIFCETKGAAIEAQLSKQSALNESAAYSKLQQITDLLKGVNGTQSGDVKQTMEKAKKQLQIATEGKQKAIQTANRQTAIAEKVLKQNRELNRKIASLEKTLAESSGSSDKGSINEGRQRLTTRRSAKPVTTRATIVENQQRRPAANPTGGFGINQIADTMDDFV